MQLPPPEPHRQSNTSLNVGPPPNETKCLLAHTLCMAPPTGRWGPHWRRHRCQVGRCRRLTSKSQRRALMCGPTGPSTYAENTTTPEIIVARKANQPDEARPMTSQSAKKAERNLKIKRSCSAMLRDSVEEEGHAFHRLGLVEGSPQSSDDTTWAPTRTKRRESTRNAIFLEVRSRPLRLTK